MCIRDSGYNVKYLYTEIGKILGIDRQHHMIIIGAGNLGQAIANYANFEKRGFIIKGMFDINPRLIGLVVRGIEIRGVDDLEQFIKDNDVQMAALTIPKTKAPEIAERLVKAGIKAIWNFAHVDLNVPEDVVVENVHLSESLMRLSYRVCSLEEDVYKRQAYEAVNRACQLVEELGAGEVVGGLIDVYSEKREESRVAFSPEKINNLLGTEIAPETMKDLSLIHI